MVGQVSWSATPHISDYFKDSPELSGSSIRASISQEDNDGELNVLDLNADPNLMDRDSNSDLDWVNLDFEVEDSNDKLHGKKDLDEEMELEQVVMEDGVNDGFASNVFDNFKF